MKKHQPAAKNGKKRQKKQKKQKTLFFVKHLTPYPLSSGLNPPPPVRLGGAGVWRANEAHGGGGVRATEAHGGGGWRASEAHGGGGGFGANEARGGGGLALTRRTGGGGVGAVCGPPSTSARFAQCLNNKPPAVATDQCAPPCVRTALNPHRLVYTLPCLWPLK